MNTKLIRCNEVVWEELDGQALLVHAQRGERWTLNASALALWKLCDGTRTVDSLAKAFSETTRRGLAECREELERFAEALSSVGLLQGRVVSNAWAAQPAQFHFEGMLSANYQGKSLAAPRRRPSPRGNSGPG